MLLQYEFFVLLESWETERTCALLWDVWFVHFLFSFLVKTENVFENVFVLNFENIFKKRLKIENKNVSFLMFSLKRKCGDMSRNYYISLAASSLVL